MTGGKSCSQSAGQSQVIVDAAILTDHRHPGQVGMNFCSVSARSRLAFDGPQWILSRHWACPSGLTASALLSCKRRVAQKPLNHRDKLGGEMFSRKSHNLSA